MNRTRSYLPSKLYCNPTQKNHKEPEKCYFFKIKVDSWGERKIQGSTLPGDGSWTSQKT